MSVSCGTGTAAVESEGAACRLEAVFLCEEPTQVAVPHLRLVRCLLQLMVGNGEGLVVDEGVGCGVGARGQACELRHSLLRHC